MRHEKKTWEKIPGFFVKEHKGSLNVFSLRLRAFAAFFFHAVTSRRFIRHIHQTDQLNQLNQLMKTPPTFFLFIRRNILSITLLLVLPSLLFCFSCAAAIKHG